MFSKLRNLLLASPALMGILILNSGSAIASESSRNQENVDISNVAQVLTEEDISALFGEPSSQNDGCPVFCLFSEKLLEPESVW